MLIIDQNSDIFLTYECTHGIIFDCLSLLLCNSILPQKNEKIHFGK